MSLHAEQSAQGGLVDAGPSHVGRPLEHYIVGDPGRAASEVTGPLRRQPGHPPEIVIDAGAFGRVTVRAASVRGLSSRFYDKPRQDDYGLGTSSDGEWLVAVVADGVAAGSLSHLAARSVVRQVPELVRAELGDRPGDRLEDVDWSGVFGAAARSIVGLGRRRLGTENEPPTVEEIAKAMSSTAVVAVCETGGDGPWRVALSWVGDSSAWVLRGDRWEPWSDTSKAQAEVGSSRVVALPALPSAGVPVRIGRLEPGDVLVLVSDGLGDPMGEGSGEVSTFLREAWSTPPDPLTFAAQASFARKSFDDDRTAVAVWFPGRPG